jgi:hypothetical protein
MIRLGAMLVRNDTTLSVLLPGNVRTKAGREVASITRFLSELSVLKIVGLKTFIIIPFIIKVK